MKKLILILMLSASFAASAQTVEHKIIVHSQGQTIKLTKADVKYIFTQTANESIREALAFNPQTIKNNDVADNIITIIKNRRYADDHNTGDLLNFFRSKIK